MNALPWIGFAATIIGGAFAGSWLMHRYEAQLDRLIDKWWGFPTVLLGGAGAIIFVALAVGQMLWVLSQ